MFLRRIPAISCCYQQVLYSTSVNNGSVLKKITKTVDPFSRIKIKSSIGLKIKPYDVHDCPNSNLLRLTITSDTPQDKQHLENLVCDVHIEDKVVNICSEYEHADAQCVLEVPVKSDLEITSSAGVSVTDMYSDHIKVVGEKDVRTRNVRCTSVDLSSTNGDVKCDGLILAHTVDIHTKNKGNIFLDKLQGDLLHCKTFDGNIETKSCYVETSKFVTETGKLALNNVHKTSEVYVLKSGVLDMTGIHGNVYIKTNGGEISLQFSEISGDNIIMANDSEKVAINISDAIEQTAFIEIHADDIQLNDSVSHMGNCLESNGKSFRSGVEESCAGKLLICVKGTLTLGKMSWADSMKLLMGKREV